MPAFPFLDGLGEGKETTESESRDFEEVVLSPKACFNHPKAALCHTWRLQRRRVHLATVQTQQRANTKIRPKRDIIKIK